MSQVNFFMLPLDTQNFIEMLLSRDDTAVLPGLFFPSQSPKPMRLPVASHPERHLTFLHSHLGKDVLPTFVESGSFAGSFMYDAFKSPVIQFTFSELQNDVLVSGRVFAKIGWLESPEQNQIYRSWYSSIERWLKKNYLRLHKDWWAGPAASDWSKKGGRLALGDVNAKKVSLANHET